MRLVRFRMVGWLGCGSENGLVVVVVVVFGVRRRIISVLGLVRLD